MRFAELTASYEQAMCRFVGASSFVMGREWSAPFPG